MTIRFSGIKPSPLPGRRNCIVELLDDGRVLLAAGDDGAGTSNVSTFVYDPSTDTWTPVGNMNVTDRNGSGSTPSSCKLNDGRVLVAGKSGTPRNGELYNPTTQTWSNTTGQHTNQTTECKLFTLPNGKALMLQRSGSPGQHELYTVSTQLFSAAAQFPKFPVDAVSYTTIVHSWRAVQLTDGINTGDVIVVGGVRQDTNQAGTFMYRYHWATDTWVALVGLITSRAGHQMCLLKNGKILIHGGFTGSGTFLNTAELYDPELDTIQAVASTNFKRRYGLLVSLDVGDSRTLAVTCFGFGQDPASLIFDDRVLNESGDLYDADADTWTPMNTVFARSYQVAGQPHAKLLDGTPIFCNQQVSQGSGIVVTESNEVIEFPPPVIPSSVTVVAVDPFNGFVTGGTLVTIHGTGFIPTTQVLFGTTPALNIIVHNDIRLTCVSPSHAEGLTDVTVFNP